MRLSAKLLQVQRWKMEHILTMEELILKLMELAEMKKFTALIRDNKLIKFLEAWRTLLDFLQEKEKNQLLSLEFED